MNFIDSTKEMYNGLLLAHKSNKKNVQKQSMDASGFVIVMLLLLSLSIKYEFDTVNSFTGKAT